MEEYVQVFTTTGKNEDALFIAETMLEERLAGCVQIVGPISSIYWWKDRIEKAEEWLCIIKTRRDLYSELEKTIEDIHPYETPEITALPLVSGSRKYLEWLASELKEM